MAATADRITQLYQQNLGRAPSPDDIQGWLSGTFGPDPESQIPASGEAQAYRASQANSGTDSGVLAPSAGTNPLENQDPVSTGGPVASAPLTGDTGNPNASPGGVPGQLNVNWEPGTPLTSANLNSAYTAAGGTLPPQATAAPAAINQNAQWGNTVYAGFSPQNYTSLPTPTGSNLAQTGKLAVYNYLQNVNPNDKNWATTAAAALNQQYGTNVFKAIDGETLGYGDEYVHSAPTGYGLPGGSYNPNAQGEFFWGYTGGGDAGGGGGAAGGGTASGGGTAAGGTGGMTLPTISATGGVSGGLALPQATTDYNSQIRQMLLSQLGNLGSPETATSPDIQPALDAYNVQSQRDQQAQRDQLAEQYYAMGNSGGGALDTGGFQTALKQNAEQAAQGRASFAGSTVFQASMAKRQQLVQMMQTASQYGLTDQAQQIQHQIALIDAALQEQGLTQQNTQANNALGFNYANLIAQQNRDALLLGING